MMSGSCQNKPPPPSLPSLTSLRTHACMQKAATATALPPQRRQSMPLPWRRTHKRCWQHCNGTVAIDPPPAASSLNETASAAASVAACADTRVASTLSFNGSAVFSIAGRIAPRSPVHVARVIVRRCAGRLGRGGILL
eukprot:TRINITY_DN3507_c0_g1_i1.p1 TRINITY_DN3507_c0_g1~~TRINITY_DN3507_c0_g1_i1.p1  ORF type:complete len:138 (+),score=21.97 TRINITY_DN3507_c0_g1_i1:189-602(+)